MNIWEIDKIYLFVIFVIPGFICLKAYELLIPGEPKESSKQIIDSIAYSLMNYALLAYPIYIVETSDCLKKDLRIILPFYFFVLFIFPVIMVVIWRKLRQTQFFLDNAPHPTLKPWDFVFNQRIQYWVKITLKDGTIIGGKYSTKSFSSSAPSPEQIYLEESWIINDKGCFDRPKNDTMGILVISDEISYIEFRRFRNG